MSPMDHSRVSTLALAGSTVIRESPWWKIEDTWRTIYARVDCCRLEGWREECQDRHLILFV
jgi:hypothetical protein